MRRALHLLLPLGALIATAAVLVLQASAGVASDGNKLQATFTPSQFVSSTNGDGIVEVIVSGAGTVDGFGAATDLVGLVQDHAVSPCGVGSYTDTASRRISLAPSPASAPRAKPRRSQGSSSSRTPPAESRDAADRPGALSEHARSGGLTADLSVRHAEPTRTDGAARRSETRS